MEGFLYERLVDNKYKVYFPLFREDVLVVEKNGKLRKCLLRVAFKSSKGSYTVRPFIVKYQPSMDGEGITHILAFDVCDRRVWLIPMADVAEMRVIRLESWLPYELLSLSQLRVSALQAASKMEQILSRSDGNLKDPLTGNNT